MAAARAAAVVGSFAKLIGERYGWMGGFVAATTILILFYYSLMMLLILALNWGGFIGALVYGVRRDARRRRHETFRHSGGW